MLILLKLYKMENNWILNIDSNVDYELSNELSCVVKAGKPTSTWFCCLPCCKRTYRTIYRGEHGLLDHIKLSLNEDDEKIKI